MQQQASSTRRAAIGFAVLAGLCGGAHAREITVCKRGCEHTLINSAVAGAASGDTISIGRGTYFENVVVTNKSLTITGYSEDYTVIDGGFQGATLTINGKSAAQNTVNLIKLTVTHGSASGIAINSATVSMQKVIVVSNLSANNGAGPGGGILAVTSVVKIARSIITHNRAPTGNGGGIAAGQGIESPSTFTIDSSTLSANEAQSGGGIFVDADSAVTLTASSLTDNSARQGGGVYLGAFRHFTFEHIGFLTLNSSTLATNRSSDSGAGIYVSIELPGGVFNNSFIVGNDAGAPGGGISLAEDGSVTLSNTTLTGNKPDNCNDPFGSNCP